MHHGKLRFNSSSLLATGSHFWAASQHVRNPLKQMTLPLHSRLASNHLEFITVLVCLHTLGTDSAVSYLDILLFL